jgi:hypothetical protein
MNMRHTLIDDLKQQLESLLIERTALAGDLLRNHFTFKATSGAAKRKAFAGGEALTDEVIVLDRRIHDLESQLESLQMSEN